MGAKAAASWRVDDQPGDLVGFVGHDRFFEETPQRHIGQRELRRDPRFVGRRRDAGQQIAAAQRRGLRQQGFQIAEDMALAAEGRGVHGREYARRGRAINARRSGAGQAAKFPAVAAVFLNTSQIARAAAPARQ